MIEASEGQCAVWKNRGVPGLAAAARLVRIGLIGLAVVALQGCVDTTIQKYGPATLPLDELNELHISTYSADFPDQTKRIPFLYRRLRTGDELYFQVFVREAGTVGGPNPNIDSITIHSFSYYFPGQPPIELISDYERGFWMQDNPRYNAEDSSPVPFNQHWHLRVRIDLTLNGIDYQFDERLDAATRRRLSPLIFWAMR